jgi:hypothetical protein
MFPPSSHAVITVLVTRFNQGFNLNASTMDQAPTLPGQIAPKIYSIVGGSMTVVEGNPA